MSQQLEKTIKLLIAEDHELTRIGLSHTLQRQEGFDIVGEVENGRDVLDTLKTVTPDIILMDIGMPVLDGIQTTQQIKQLYPGIKVMMLTSHKEEEEVLASFAAGADAYCSKDTKVERLIQAVEMVVEGVVWLDPAIASIVMNTLNNRPANTEEESAGRRPRQRYSNDLTEREMDVLRNIVEGKSNKEIAVVMNLSIYTVKAHVCNIIQKLAVDDRTQAAVKALKTGMLN